MQSSTWTTPLLSRKTFAAVPTLSVCGCPHARVRVPVPPHTWEGKACMLIPTTSIQFHLPCRSPSHVAKVSGSSGAGNPGPGRLCKAVPTLACVFACSLPPSLALTRQCHFLRHDHTHTHSLNARDNWTMRPPKRKPGEEGSSTSTTSSSSSSSSSSDDDATPANVAKRAQVVTTWQCMDVSSRSSW